MAIVQYRAGFVVRADVALCGCGIGRLGYNPGGLGAAAACGGFSMFDEARFVQTRLE